MRAVRQLFVTYRVAVLLGTREQNTPRRAIWRPAPHRQAARHLHGSLPSLAGTIAGRVAVPQNWPIQPRAIVPIRGYSGSWECHDSILSADMHACIESDLEGR